MCGLKDTQLDAVRRDLRLAEESNRATKLELSQCQSTLDAAGQQLEKQRDCRIKAEAEAEDARCAMRVLQIESAGLRRQCDASSAK